MLNKLKKEFLNKEHRLVTLDRKVIGMIEEEMNIEFIPESIFEYDVRDMLASGFCYQYQNTPIPEGFNFEFEIVEDSEDLTRIIVKVVNIDVI